MKQFGEGQRNLGVEVLWACAYEISTVGIEEARIIKDMQNHKQLESSLVKLLCKIQGEIDLIVLLRTYKV